MELENFIPKFGFLQVTESPMPLVAIRIYVYTSCLHLKLSHIVSMATHEVNAKHCLPV